MAAIQKRKIRWAISLFLVMLYFNALPAQAQYGGGSGDPNDPYLIYTAEQMNAIGAEPNDWDKHFKLMADIDLSGVIYSEAVIPIFKGTFDGNGLMISHLTIAGGGNLGLFGRLESGTVVKDLGVVDVNITGSNHDLGGLVGYNRGVVMECYSTGTVSGEDRVGGLLGGNVGVVMECYSTGSVTGNRDVGGLVGYNQYGDMTTSYSRATVTGERFVGGLVGRNEGSIATSYSTGSVSGESNVGGLVGINDGSISTSYSTGSVTGSRDVGGLVGYNNQYGDIATSYSTATATVTGERLVGGLVGRNGGSIATSYSTGRVNGAGDYVGGLVGGNRYGKIISSFWDVETSGQSSRSSGTGLATAEMQDINTFLTEGWDFVDETLNGTCDYWQISPDDYPRLRYHFSHSPVMPEGLGTLEQPYLIRDARDLGTVWFKPRAHYDLEASVDLSGITWSMAVVPWFGGTFDGNGYVISNLHIQGGGYLGLFGKLGSGAKISNLGLEAVDVNGTGDNVGGLVGSNSGSITTSYSTGTVSGDNNIGGLVGGNLGRIATSYSTGSVTGDESVGGLVGRNSGSTTTSYSTGSVTGNWNVGGLVGYNGGDITTSYSTGSVSGDEGVGGLVGNNYGTISNCYAAGSVSGYSIEWFPVGVGGLVGSNEGTISDCSSAGSVVGDENVGGLVGQNGTEAQMGDSGGAITNCYSTGSVAGTKNVGGLVGTNSSYGTIADCYSTSPVTGDNSVGGLAGYNENILAHCYATGSVAGATNVGGLVGHNNYSGWVYNSFWDIQTSGQSTSVSGTGKTTAEMQDPNTFMDAGWDFVGEFENGPSDDWAQPTGGGYPILWWQLSPLPELPSFSGGTGEPNDPYLISTGEDLNRIGHNSRLMNAHFKLINNIGLTGIDFFIIGSELFPFAGVFDGNGYTISNFSYTSTDTGYIGLFGYVDDPNAEIRDLGLIDPNIDAGTGDHVGSLVGYNFGTITNCYVEGGRVTGNENVGGLVGDNDGTITNCYDTASVSGNARVGGLVGYNGGSRSASTISNCYSSGDVSGNSTVGGLVGENILDSTIANCYSSGDVSGDDNVGGLVGLSDARWLGWGEITFSFWDIETSGQTRSSGGGTGKTTDEMQMESTFTDAGWDFVGETANGTEDTWSICEGTNYPRLAWQIPAGDFVCPDGITIEDFLFFIEHWRDDNCDSSNDYCDGTDLDFSGTVDEADLEILIENWLESSELEN